MVRDAPQKAALLTMRPGDSVALAIGDPAGIGPEVVLKILAQDAERSKRAIVVGDAAALARHATACGIAVDISRDEFKWPDGRRTRFVDCNTESNVTWTFGEASAAGGRACLAFVTRAVAMARAGEVAAVLAAPHN